jgi:hypothetical protein
VDLEDLMFVQKLQAFYTQAEHLDQFGLEVNEIVKTPLGLHGTVIGVKYSSSEQAESLAGGKIWIKYMNGLESPIEYEPAHGYSKASISDHIARDVNAYNEELEKLAEERRQQEEAMRLRALGIEPPPKGKEKAGKGKGKK